MAGNFQQSKWQTDYCYKNVLLPVLKARLKAHYEIYSVENDSSELAKLLDWYGGCDYLLINKNKKTLEGMASRIQPVQKSWDTFTIRLKRDNDAVTEFEKLKNAIARKSIYPKYTLQAYVSEDMQQLLNMAIMSTDDLFKFAETNQVATKHTGEAQIGSASFIVCSWQDIRAAGFEIWSFK